MVRCSQRATEVAALAWLGRAPLWAALTDRIRELIQQQPDVAERRQELQREQPLLNPDRLVFIDETWATTNMTRPRGRALKGQRVVASVPHGHWKTTTFLAALRATGLTAPLGQGLSTCRRTALTSTPSNLFSRSFGELCGRGVAHVVRPWGRGRNGAGLVHRR